jgi:DNA-3-methyladenine glycosylase I
MEDRCGWCGSDPLYIAYHDEEWGVPEYDGRALWEKLILDGFQAGLSWITILRKRAAFREAFEGFEPNVIAGWGEPEVARLLANPGIVRHRGKIEAVVNNAAPACELVEVGGSMAAFVWRFEPDEDGSPPQTRSTSPASQALSKELRKRGWTARRLSRQSNGRFVRQR